MAKYSLEQAGKIRQNFLKAHQDLLAVYGEAIVFSHSRLFKEEAKKFMLHGVARRLGLIRHTAARIFEAFPPEQKAPLGREKLEDINVYLHGFVLHVNALQDNLAWAFVHEFDVTIDPRNVSLFKKALQKHLPAAVREYVTRNDIEKWRGEYATDFRDALAHRIPLYVPPAQLSKEEGERAEELQHIFNDCIAKFDLEGLIKAQDEINALGSASPYYLHDGKGIQIVLHPQIVCDVLTAVDLYKIVICNWPNKPEHA